MAIGPKLGVNQAHAERAGRLASAGLVWGEQYLRTLQRGHSNVFTYIIIVAGQHAHPSTVRSVENGIFRAASYVFADKAVNLAMPPHLPVRGGDHVGIVKFAIVCDLDQTGADSHVVLLRKPKQLTRRRTIRNRLGQLHQLLAGEIAKEPISGQAAFGEGDNLDILRSSLLHEASNLLKVGILIPGGVLELNGGNTDVLHLLLPGGD